MEASEPERWETVSVSDANAFAWDVAGEMCAASAASVKGTFSAEGDGRRFAGRAKTEHPVTDVYRCVSPSFAVNMITH